MRLVEKRRELILRVARIRGAIQKQFGVFPNRFGVFQNRLVLPQRGLRA